MHNSKLKKMLMSKSPTEFNESGLDGHTHSRSKGITFGRKKGGSNIYGSRLNKTKVLLDQSSTSNISDKYRIQ